MCNIPWRRRNSFENTKAQTYDWKYSKLYDLFRINNMFYHEPVLVHDTDLDQ